MKKSTFWAVCVTVILLFGFHLPGWSQALVTSDNFNYTDNSLLTANGWVAHSGAGTAPIAVGTSNGLSYAGYSGVSGVTGVIEGNAAKLVATGEDDSKTFTAITSGTLYFSFLTKVTTGTSGYYIHLGANATSFAAKLWVKPSATAGKINFGTSNGTTAVYAATPTDFDPLTTYLVIFKYDVSTTGAVSLWIKSTGVPATEVAAGTPEVTTSGSGQASIDRVCLRQYAATQSMEVDGIRLGTTWESTLSTGATATITVAPTSLTGFNYVIGSGPSAAQTFTVSGTNLTNNISIAASTNFEISLSSTTGYTTPIVLTQTGGTVTSTTIYARLKAGLPAASYSAEALNITSTGATSQSVTCFGVVNPLGPVINVGTVTAFANQAINTLSATKTYNVSGANLTSNIIVTAPAGFQISTTNDPGFVSGSPITLNQTGGTVASTPIYIKFAPTSAITYTGNITHTSTSATTQNVAVTGTGIAGEPTNHVTNFTAGTATSTTIPLTWTDATGGTVPNGYLIKASPVSYAAISNPVDGTAEVNSTLAQNVAQGVGNVTFSGLNSGTPYFFQIYPYTGSGATIDYKTTAPVPQATATTLVVPALVLYEDFNYTPPAFIGGNTAIPSSSNNWTTHSGGGGTIDVYAGNLSYAGLANPSGYKVMLPGDNAAVSRDVNRAFTTPNTSAVLYYSTVINVVDATQLQSLVLSEYFMHFGACSGDACTIFGARLGIIGVNSFANFRLSILNTSGGTPVYSEFPLDLNYAQNYLVVVNYDRSTSPTTATLWINPTSLGGAEPGTGSVTNSTGTGTFNEFGSICLRNNANTPKVEIDEIRVGTTWADVTPVGSPTLAADPTSLVDFLYFVGSGPSPSKTFNINGTALTPTSGSLTVTGSTHYEVSANNTSFGPTASIPYTQATFTGTPVYVRLKAGFPVAAYNGESITIAGGGASSATVTCSGNVVPLAPIIVAGTISGFGNQAIGSVSAEQSYTVSGSYLTGNIVITPPVGFQISTTSGTGFISNPNTITLTQTGGNVPSTNIYVVFAPTALQAYSGNIVHASSGATNELVPVSGTGIKGEPTNYPTLFLPGTVTSTTIPLTWTDATTGTFIPDGYLIKGSSVSLAAIVDPVDLLAESNSALVQNIAQGVHNFTFTGLTAGGTYYFKIYPYTNSGTAIDYKTFPAGPTASAQTTPPPAQTYTWNQTAAASWAVATNWTPSRTTLALNDILVFDGALTPTVTANAIPAQTIGQLKLINGATVNLQGAAIGILTIGGGTGTDLSVPVGCTLSINSTVGLSILVATGATGEIYGNFSLLAGANKLTAFDATGISFKSGSLFTAGAGLTGNPFGATYANSVVFENGSTFLFITGSNPFALTAPSSVVVFQTGSLYVQQGSNSPSFAGRTYANVRFNYAATFTLSGAGAVSVDNLTIDLGTINFNLTTDPGHSIKGNISVATGAALNFTPATAGTVKLNGTTPQSITVNGTFSTGTFSTIEIDNTTGVTLNNSIAMNGGLKFTNGLLNLGANNLTLGAASAISGTPSASSMIVATGAGELRKTFAATGSFIYPVGDNTVTAEYSPVTLNFTAGTFAAAYAGVKLTNAVYGASANHLKRYWDLSSSGITSFTCDALFNYVPADVLGTEGSIYCVRISPAANFAVANTTLHQLSATGVTEFGTFTGQDQVSTSKTLNLTSVFLEGLYAGNGTMNTAALHVPPFGAGVADLITVELHNPTTYLLAVSIPNVQLSTTGTATVTVPSTYNGSYHITIKHRNSIETTTLNPVSFAGSTINQAFTVGNVYGGNLGLMAGPGTYYAIYAGDVDQNGSIDSGDFTPIDNDVTNYASGYLATDVNGDGSVDTGDFTSVDNNGLNYIGTVHP